MYRLKGKLIEKGEIKSFGENNKTKMEFILKDSDSQFESLVKFEIYNGMIEMIKGTEINEEIEVDFNVRGNKYKDKYYTNLVAFRVFKNDSSKDFPF